jgi:alanyl-tRNA synthetase
MPPSEFTGYDELKSNSKVIGLDKKNNGIVLDKTPFYVESGGQIDDLGKISTKENSFDVVDVAKVDNKIIHVVENTDQLKKGTIVIAEVDEKRRWDIMRNHTATHFLHAALRKILGTHVMQANAGRLIRRAGSSQV